VEVHQETNENLAALTQALSERLAKSPLLGEIFRELDDDSSDAEREMMVAVWRPYAKSCVVRLLRAIHDVQDRSLQDTATFTGEDIGMLAKAAIAVSHSAKGLGLDDTTRHQVADLTAAVFSDQATFYKSKRFSRNGTVFRLFQNISGILTLVKE